MTNQARRDIDGFSETRRAAESTKAQAEAELYNAEEVEETNLKARIQRRNVERVNKMVKSSEEDLVANNMMASGSWYAEVMKELEFAKQDLSKLKEDMKSVLEEKLQAEKEIEVLKLKAMNQAIKGDEIRIEIEEANEEQVLVELANIEACKVYEAIEYHVELEAERYGSKVEENQKQKERMVEEIESAKALESEWTRTMSDVNMLHNELKQVKQLDSVAKRCGSFSFQQDEEARKGLLESVTKELAEAKRELTLIKDEGFQFMASMDVIRNELRRAMEETERLRKAEEKANVIINNLNSKLLRAKAKLDAVTSAEEKAKSIASNLVLTLKQLSAEAEKAKHEKEVIGEETMSLKAETEKIESNIDSNEEKLQAALQELHMVKCSEEQVLEKLKQVTEQVMGERALQSDSFIIFSNFEYEYLTDRASGVEELANKKVAAAQAWIEALKAGEKEILMRTEVVQREMRLQLKCEKGIESKMQLDITVPRKSFDENGSLTPVRRSIRIRKSRSPATRHSKSGSHSGKKGTKGTSNLSMFGSNKEDY